MLFYARTCTADESLKHTETEGLRNNKILLSTEASKFGLSNSENIISIEVFIGTQCVQKKYLAVAICTRFRSSRNLMHIRRHQQVRRLLENASIVYFQHFAVI